MIIGHTNLKKLYPDFQEDVQENGIDLRVGKVKIITKKYETIGCINDKKYVPTYHTIQPQKNHENEEECYTLLPQNYYFIEIDRPMHIPQGYIQQYYLRSSFSRCGLILTDAIGDSDFQGTLMVGIYNASPKPVSIGVNERIIQAVTIKTDGTETQYSGDYQNDKIYKEQE